MRLQLYEVNTSKQMGPGSPKLNTSLLGDDGVFFLSLVS